MSKFHSSSQINRQPQFNKEEVSPPLPSTHTHPLYKVQATNNGQLYNSNASIPPPKNFATNPWEREEREKEVEFRREQARQWREYQINELSAIQHRSPQQEEQLKTLILERDFQRMAQEQNDIDEEDNAMIRLAQSASAISSMAAPVTNMKQIDVKMSVVAQTSPSIGTSSMLDSPASSLSDTLATASYVSAQPAQITSLPTGQPKSILKHNSAPHNISNPSSPSKQAKSTSFAVDRESAGTNIVSHLARDLNSLNFNDYDTTTPISKPDENSYDAQIAPPPPPPERNSSYVIMSQKQQTLRSSLGGTTTQQTVLSKSTTTTTTNVTSSSIGPLVDEQSNANFNATHKKSSPNNNNNSSSSHHNNGLGNAVNAANVNGINSNGNNNGSAAINNNANASNNNNINNNGPTTANIQSVSQLSLAAVMANRDNKRVSFHDEENNYVSTSTSATNDTSDLESIREDPNVS